MKARVRLVCWNEAEGGRRAAWLGTAGYETQAGPVDAAALKELRARPPDAVVIDLSRLPSHGRDVALWLRQAKSTRHVPIVIAGGAPEKIASLRELLPDAAFAPWERLRGALRRALDHPPADPVVPASTLAGYSGTPLPRKLGIKPGARVGLLGAPDGFENTLGELPEGTTLSRGPKGRHDLTLWFTTSRRQLEQGMASRAAALGRDGLWIAWPKKASGAATDLSEGDVRRTGLEAGLVDFKICAIDTTWSGLKFTRRRAR